MPRKTQAASGSNTRATASALRQLRNSIDKLDVQILKLINQRFKAAADIGKIKNSSEDTEVFSAEREEEVLAHVLRVHEKGKPLVDSQAIRSIFREIISASRGLQKVVKVAYLGPEHTFSHLAAIERFGQSVEYTCVNSIAAVFETVERGHVDFGVVPIENSTDGRIADTLEMFQRMPKLSITAEIRLQIHHNLLANCEPQRIVHIYSKAQVLSQCRNWLSKNMPHAALKEVGSSAIAAKLASEQRDSGAIASRQAAARYGLRIQFADIEDTPDNETRFAVIGHQKSARTNNDKTAIMFQLPHKPGSLAGALEIFKKQKVNLTWIESFPSRIEKGYLFFVDFEGHANEPKVQRTLKALDPICEEIRVLGSFPAADPLET